MQEQILQSRQARKDVKQDIHRVLNSIFIVGIFICSIFAAYNVSDQFNVVEEKSVEVSVKLKEVDNKFNQLSTAQHKTTEITQLMMDEGFRKCVYKDSRGLATIGFGHLMLPIDTYRCIDYRKAIELLRSDYDYASNSVDTKYPWVKGEARLVLINMTYQMGQSGVSKFEKTLENLENKSYDDAAIELLDSKWANQTPKRALRLAGRIMSISIQEEEND